MTRRRTGTVQEQDAATDLPKIGAPATRALLAAGYSRLEHLTRLSEAELAGLHGVGPKAVGILRQALAERGLRFAGG